MIYGTHNSLSYLKPRQWWLRPVAWIARCQDMTIEEQLQYGVRYFDIRVKFHRGIAISGHGLMDYDIPVHSVLHTIQHFFRIAHGEDRQPRLGTTPTIRLVLEDKRGNADRFREFFGYCTTHFPDLRFIGGWRKDPYEQIIPDTEADTAHHQYKLYQDHSARTWMEKLRGLRFPYPLYWARRDNARIKSRPWKLWDTVVMDYVQIR